MNLINLLIFFVLCGSFVTAESSVYPSIIPTHARGGSVYREAVRRHRLYGGRLQNMTANYHDQLIDHNNPSLGTFKQRWYVDTSSWTCEGPALLYIGGEGPAESSPGGYAQVYGQSIHAAMFTLEHRFYGESMPAPLTNRSMLKYLTIENALADLRAFKRYAEKHVLGKSTRWILVGGSYAGALSAWTREKYPDDFFAAWSSSGVVNLIFDFSAFDGHILNVIPPACASAIRYVFDEFSAAYDDPEQRDNVMQQFGTPSYFTKADMAWMLADASAMAVQYGNKDALCASILPIDPKDPFSKYINMINDFWGPGFTSGCAYSTQCLSNSSFSAQWDSGYTWVYQCCSQTAFWQTSYPGSLRLPEITTSYFMNQCREAFGDDIMPDTFAFNKRFGGARPWATRVVATQGSDDPWLPAGVSEPLSSDYPEFTAECSGCGHCGDLSVSGGSGNDAVTKQQKAVTAQLNSWLNIPQFATLR